VSSGRSVCLRQATTTGSSSAVRTVDRGSFGPIRRSATDFCDSHSAPVFGHGRQARAARAPLSRAVRTLSPFRAGGGATPARPTPTSPTHSSRASDFAGGSSAGRRVVVEPVATGCGGRIAASRPMRGADQALKLTPMRCRMIAGRCFSSNRKWRPDQSVLRRINRHLIGSQLPAMNNRKVRDVALHR
jgi:hypothetical protein